MQGALGLPNKLMQVISGIRIEKEHCVKRLSVCELVTKDGNFLIVRNPHAVATKIDSGISRRLLQ